jgi:uncharacterized damage-inducible protein DinB
MSRPQPGEYNSFFERYINQTKAQNAHALLEELTTVLESFYTILPESKADYAYALGKWTLKEVLQHVTDTERIFSYRLLRIARKDATPLPSFEENDYVVNADANRRSFDAIKQEFLAVRKASNLLIESLTVDQLNNKGIVSGTETSANAIAFILFGHLMHHKAVIEERYL